MLAQREAEHKYGPIPPLSRVEILTAPPPRIEQRLRRRRRVYTTMTTKNLGLRAEARRRSASLTMP